MRKIVPLLLILLLISGCASRPPVQTSTQPVLPSEASSQPVSPSEVPAATPNPQKLPPDWHYDLNKDGLFRMDRNTGGVAKISNQHDAADIIITEDWLYFIDNGGLFRMDNESKRELLTDEECRNLILNGNSIYYINDTGISRMSADGSGKEQILQCDCKKLALSEKYIFYALYVPEAEELNNQPGADDGPWYMGELRRADLNGENDIKIADMITELGAYNDTIYYADASDDKLYALNPETLGKKLPMTAILSNSFISAVILLFSFSTAI